MAAATLSLKATLIRPDGREVQFAHKREAVGSTIDHILLIYGDRTYDSELELDKEWQTGEYVFLYSLPGLSGLVSFSIRLRAGEYLADPKVRLEQNGEKVVFEHVDSKFNRVTKFTPSRGFLGTQEPLCIKR